MKISRLKDRFDAQTADRLSVP